MRYSARDLSIGGLFGAMAVALPILFHMVGLGRAFLPMHLPVLVCGLLVSPLVSFAVGLVVPIISSALTGMPPLIPTAILMTLELGALGASAGACRRALRLPVIVSVALAMAAARVVGGLETLALAPVMGLKPSLPVFLSESVLVSLPGIILQLIAAPLAIAAIDSTRGRHAKQHLEGK